MKKMDLKTVQELLIDVLEDVDEICKKNNITYYLFSGTLLGAARHKGFIPWDDDIDIAMMRPDFERFLKACERELDEKYFLQTYRTDPYFYKSLARVCLLGTFIDEQWSEHIPFNKSLYLDIFPLDRIGESKKEKMKQVTKVGRIDRCLFFKSGYVYNKGFLNYKLIIKTLIRKVLAPLPFKFLMERREKTIRKYEGTDNAYLCNFGDLVDYLRSINRVSRFGEPAYLEFEGKMYPVPQDWDGYLKQIYGDYMKLPPVDKRMPEHDVYFL